MKNKVIVKNLAQGPEGVIKEYDIDNCVEFHLDNGTVMSCRVTPRGLLVRKMTDQDYGSLILLPDHSNQIYLK